MLAHVLFTWIQGAQFYKDVHREAVEMVPSIADANWLDVGCGPGLISRLAGQRGYRVTGIDADARMINAAKRLAKHDSRIQFSVGSVFDISADSANVVSAASLLAVLDDKSRALHALWSAVRAPGYLLIVEPTAKMNPENAQSVAMHLPAKRLSGLHLWARARANRAVPDYLFDEVRAAEVSRVDLLGGLVAAHLFKKQ